MFRFSDIRIKPKLIFLFIATGIIPLGLVGLFGNMLTVNSLMEKSFTQLTTVQIIHIGQVEDAFRERFDDIEILANTQRIRDLLDNLKSYSETMGTLPSAEIGRAHV